MNHEKDSIISELLSTNMWIATKRPSLLRAINTLVIHSNMKGYTNGRYRLEVTKLKRHHKGKFYKILLFWTPYDPYDKVFDGRVNTYEELKQVLGLVNPDLIDTSRATQPIDMINEIGHLSTCCEAEIIMGCGDMGKCKSCGENTTSILFEAKHQKSNFNE